MSVVKKMLKTSLLLLLLLAVISPVHAKYTHYMDDHKTVAEVLSAHYGIPVSVILAVAYVESSGGNGATAKVLNNHFGIEGHNSFVNCRGHKSRYKQYSNELLSYIDFCRLLTRKKFYPRLKNNDDAVAWVKAISHAGYSEQPQQWEQKVLGTIRAHQL